MNHEMYFWKIWQTVWLRGDDSLRVWTSPWLQTLPGCLGNVLESFRSFELSSRYEISFKLFMKILQSGCELSATISCMYQLGFIMLLYVNMIRSKKQAQGPSIHVLKIWFSIISISIFCHWNPCQSWRIFPFWMRNDLPPCPSLICCTKKI